MLPSFTRSRRYSRVALHTTLQLCAAAVLLCALAVGFMSMRRTAAEQRNELGAQHIQSARARLARASERLDLIEKYQAKYRQMVGEGATVRFDRSIAGDWFDIAISKSHAGLVDEYMIGKDAPYIGPETSELTAFHVVAHRLEFDAGAADEDDFVELMSSIQQRIPGTTAQEACSLTRNRAATDGAPQLKVKCALVWYEFSAGG
ncbi:MAG TPA: hypothetical protein VGI65_05445 [Steroidobacteraceae bacterium]